MTRPTYHSTTIRLHRGYGEWVAECSCGWTGSYLASREAAVLEAAGHREANVQIGDR